MNGRDKKVTNTEKRLAEIRRRLQEIDRDHAGIDLTPEARAEFKRLETEAERLHLTEGEER